MVVQCLEIGLCQHLLDGLMAMGRGRQEPAAVRRETEGYRLLDGEGRRYPLTAWAPPPDVGASQEDCVSAWP
jgi:hypothetical protein